MKIIIILLLLFTGVVNAQVVNIPDANFKAKLISIGIDTNSNGDIELVEALSVTTLDLSESMDIADLTGIESFTNLTLLDCETIGVTTLDVSALTNLITLKCNFNNALTSLVLGNLPQLEFLDCTRCYSLASIDVTSCPNLQHLDLNNCDLNALDLGTLTNIIYLDCSDNNLTTLSLGNLSLLSNLICIRNLLTGLDVSSLTNLTQLLCSGNSIPVLDVSALTNLVILECQENLISVLDVSDLINLEYLYCGINQISELDLSALSNLTNLECYQNQITALNLSGLPQLVSFSCDNNQITSLDVSNLLALTYLNCTANPITALDLSGLPNLTGLRCGSPELASLNINSVTGLTDLAIFQSQLPGIDLSNFTQLSSLDIYETPFTSIDVSSCTSLGIIHINNNNNLVYANLKNGMIQSPNVSNCPNLIYICTDEQNIESTSQQLEFSGNPNIAVSSYCTFVPSGNYNTITGTMLYDFDLDGCDSDDTLLPLNKINIDDGTVTGAAFTNNESEYTFYTGAGSFMLTPQIENAGYFTILPAAPVNVNFAVANNLVTTQNFCITPNGVHPDVEIVIAPVIPARPGFDATYKIVYKNKGNQTVSGSIALTFDDTKLDFVSSAPSPNAQVVDLLTFDYSNFLPFENREILITINVNGPTETPPVNIGDILDFVAVINPITGDENGDDNTFKFDQTVVGSYDPNDKTCLEGDVVAPTEIGNYLHYIINFENTGTAPATNVVVKDIIDISQFDINSLQVMNASHPVEIKITGNVVEFIFQNINLPSAIANPIGGHGNVLFKIKTLPTLPIGTMVSNTANIYFDYNFPIETNEARTTFENLSSASFIKDDSVTIYPNPANHFVNITSANTVKTIQLFDVQGRIIQSSTQNKKSAVLDISKEHDGIYFLKITTEKGSKVEKIVKE